METPIPTGNSLATPYPYESRLLDSMVQASPNSWFATSKAFILSSLAGAACSEGGFLAVGPYLYATALCARPSWARGKPTYRVARLLVVGKDAPHRFPKDQGASSHLVARAGKATPHSYADWKGIGPRQHLATEPACLSRASLPPVNSYSGR